MSVYPLEVCQADRLNAMNKINQCHYICISNSYVSIEREEREICVNVIIFLLGFTNSVVQLHGVVVLGSSMFVIMA